MKIYHAHFDFRHMEFQAFGLTALEAKTALIQVIEDWEKENGIEPFSNWMPDELSVHEFETGQGYGQGTFDWHTINSDKINVYTVDADRATGEWLSDPTWVKAMPQAEWHELKDTDDVHYDTTELNDQTIGIEVHWYE
jgi:hypothetical protein